jgi:hypothetical protein
MYRTSSSSFLHSRSSYEHKATTSTAMSCDPEPLPHTMAQVGMYQLLTPWPGSSVFALWISLEGFNIPAQFEDNLIGTANTRCENEYFALTFNPLTFTWITILHTEIPSGLQYSLKITRSRSINSKMWVFDLDLGPIDLALDHHSSHCEIPSRATIYLPGLKITWLELPNLEAKIANCEYLTLTLDPLTLPWIIILHTVKSSGRLQNICQDWR